MNVVAFFHAYKFTHFNTSKSKKTPSPSGLTTSEKFKAVIFGISNPRPENKKLPEREFETVVLESNRRIECWYFRTDSSRPSRGTVILFHGYGGEKSSMTNVAGIFDSLQFNTLLVDFMGSGGSEGNNTTIGYKEADQVKTAFEFVKEKGEKNIYLFGTSLGAVAIMKAMDDYALAVSGLILECPFGSMYETVCARFDNMNVPRFPMAGLLVFWGGVQNGFWAFGHNPTEYAKSIQCPTLLLYGEKDEKVSVRETEEIFDNLPGRKKLRTFPDAGHESYLLKYGKEWIEEVSEFLNV